MTETVEQKHARIKELELALSNKGVELKRANRRIQQLEEERGKRGQESLASVIQERRDLQARIDAALALVSGIYAEDGHNVEDLAHDLREALSTPTENGEQG